MILLFCFILGQKRSAWMKESSTAPIISSSCLLGKEIMMRDLGANNTKSVGKVTSLMEKNKLFPSPPLNVACFIFCQLYKLFFCVLMYDIYILPISHLPIFLSHIYHCMKKKENENLQLKRCVWRMRREIITIQNKQFWRLFNYVMIKLFLFTTRECYLIYILSVTLWNIVHAFFNALDNWHHHMDFVKIPCDQCNPIPS